MASPIKINILGDSKSLTTALGEAQAKLQAFGLANNKMKIAAGVGGAALLGIGIAGVKMAIDMDQARRDFELSTGMVGKNAEAAFEEMIDAGGRVSENFDVVTAAGGNLAKTTGFLGDDLENLTVQFLELNGLGFGSVSENEVGEYFKTWGLEGDAAASSMDMLAQVSQATGVDIGLLTDSTTSNAGALSKMGLSNVEAIQMMGQWEKSGIDTNKIFRSLNSNIDSLTSQGKDTTKMMDDMRNVMDDGNLSTKEAALLYELFGAEATDVIKQLEAGTISLKDFDEGMGLSGQTVGEMDNSADSLGEKFLELRNRIMMQLAPSLLKLGDLLIRAVDWFIVDILPAIVTFSKQGIAAIKQVVDWITTVAVPAIKAFSEDAVAFFQDAYNKIKPILDGLVTYITGVFDAIMGVWNTFSALFKGDWRGVWNGIKQVFRGVWQALKGIFAVAWSAFKLYVQGVLATFRILFKERLDAIVGFFRDLPTRFLNGVTNGWNAVVRGVGTLVNDVKLKVKEKIDDIIQLVKDLPQKVTDAAKGAFDGISEAFLGVVGAVRDAWNGMDPEISVSIPSWVPGIGGRGWESGDLLPDFAYGGTARSGFAMVGERGPELIRMPLGGGSVESTRDAFFGGGAGGAGANVTINMHGHNSSPAQIAAEVVWQMRRAK